MDYSRLVAPRDDGEVLIEPSASTWRSLMERNARLLEEASVTLAGVDAREVRRALRTRLHGAEAGRLVLACGHQPAFVHPGVWAKHVVVRNMSERLGSAAFDLVVDNDAPTSPDLVVPVVENGYVVLRNVSFSDAPSGSAYENWPGVNAARTREIAAELRRAMRADTYDASAMPAYLDAVETRAGAPFVDQHLAGRERIDGALHATLPEHRVSAVLGGPFVADLLLEADRFAGAYNEALQNYRQRENVRTPDRPLPDLARHGARIETAFWIYKPLQRRRRLWIEPLDDRIILRADEERAGELGGEALRRDPDAALATLSPWCVRPRALTLTLWARLLACDLFVHGIGGAKYDRVTDDIFRLYYRIEPPALACVTATLRLDLPRFAATPDDLLRAGRAARDVRYNPQRYLSAPPEDLVAQRAQLIRASEDLRSRRASRMNRRAVYQAIRHVNAQLLSAEPALAEQLADRVRQRARELASNQLADSREYFYALHSRSRLNTLAETLQSSAGA